MKVWRTTFLIRIFEKRFTYRAFRAFFFCRSKIATMEIFIAKIFIFHFYKSQSAIKFRCINIDGVIVVVYVRWTIFLFTDSAWRRHTNFVNFSNKLRNDVKFMKIFYYHQPAHITSLSPFIYSLQIQCLKIVRYKVTIDFISRNSMPDSLLACVLYPSTTKF